MAEKNKKLDNQPLTEEEKSNAILHKNNSLQRLDKSFINHIELEEYKKTHLLAYWISDFSDYHDNEKTFDTTKLISFKRGNIIKVNLGFNIGHELGGLHYCVVLDKFDNPKNGTLNVIPLTSKKSKKYPSSSVDLGNELFNILSKVYNKKIQVLSSKYNDIWSLPTEQVKQFTADFEYIKKVKAEISKMQKGSIALINQITTISKQRILDDGVLQGIRLSNESLDLLDKQIVKNFTK